MPKKQYTTQEDQGTIDSRHEERMKRSRPTQRTSDDAESFASSASVSHHRHHDDDGEFIDQNRHKKYLHSKKLSDKKLKTEGTKKKKRGSDDGDESNSSCSDSSSSDEVSNYRKRSSREKHPNIRNKNHVPTARRRSSRHGSSSAACAESKGQSQQGFYFKPRREKLNWHILSHIDVEQLMDDVDIDTLESITKNMTFSKVEKNDLRYFTEENFVHLFQLCQLIIEYLLYVQNYLASKRSSMETDVESILQDIDKYREALIKKNEENTYLKRDIKRLKRTVFAYQLVYGANPEKAKILLQAMKSGGGLADLAPAVPATPIPVAPLITHSDNSLPLFGEIHTEMRKIRDDIYEIRSKMKDDRFMLGMIEKKEADLNRAHEQRLRQMRSEFASMTQIASTKSLAETLQEPASNSVSVPIASMSQPVRRATVVAVSSSPQFLGDERRSEPFANTAHTCELPQKSKELERLAEESVKQRDSQLLQFIDDKIGQAQMRWSKNGAHDQQELVQLRDQIQEALVRISSSTIHMSEDARVSLGNNANSIDRLQYIPADQTRGAEILSSNPDTPKTKTDLVRMGEQLRPARKSVQIAQVQSAAMEGKETSESLDSQPIPSQTPTNSITTSTSKYIKQRESVGHSQTVTGASLEEELEYSSSSEEEDVLPQETPVGSTAYEPGRLFAIDESKPHMHAKFNHHIHDVLSKREQLADEMELELNDRGIDANVEGLSKKEFDKKMLQVHKARDNDPDLKQMVNHLRKYVEEIASRHAKEQTSKARSSTKQLKSAPNAASPGMRESVSNKDAGSRTITLAQHLKGITRKGAITKHDMHIDESQPVLAPLQPQPQQPVLLNTEHGSRTSTLTTNIRSALVPEKSNLQNFNTHADCNKDILEGGNAGKSVSVHNDIAPAEQQDPVVRNESSQNRIRSESNNGSSAQRNIKLLAVALEESDSSEEDRLPQTTTKNSPPRPITEHQQEQNYPTPRLPQNVEEVSSPSKIESKFRLQEQRDMRKLERMKQEQTMAQEAAMRVRQQLEKKHSPEQRLQQPISTVLVSSDEENRNTEDRTTVLASQKEAPIENQNQKKTNTIMSFEADPVTEDVVTSREDPKPMIGDAATRKVVSRGNAPIEEMLLMSDISDLESIDEVEDEPMNAREKPSEKSPNNSPNNSSPKITVASVEPSLGDLSRELEELGADSDPVTRPPQKQEVERTLDDELDDITDGGLSRLRQQQQQRSPPSLRLDDDIVPISSLVGKRASPLTGGGTVKKLSSVIDYDDFDDSGIDDIEYL